MDGHCTFCRSGVQAHGLPATQCGAHGHVPLAAGCHPLVGDGYPMAPFRRRAYMALAAPFGCGGLCDWRLLPHAGLYLYRLALRSALHDPLGPHRRHHGALAYRRGDEPVGHRGHVRHADGYRHVHPLQARPRRRFACPCSLPQAQPPQKGDSLRQYGRYLSGFRVGA